MDTICTNKLLHLIYLIIITFSCLNLICSLFITICMILNYLIINMIISFFYHAFSICFLFSFSMLNHLSFQFRYSFYLPNKLMRLIRFHNLTKFNIKFIIFLIYLRFCFFVIVFTIWWLLFSRSVNFGWWCDWWLTFHFLIFIVFNFYNGFLLNNHLILVHLFGF